MFRSLFILVTICLLSVYAFAKAAPAQCDYCPWSHREIVEGRAQSPYRYRLLSAALVELVTTGDDDLSIQRGYLLLHLLAIPAMLVSLYLYYRQWLNDDRALIGVLLVALYLPLMFEIWSISLYDALQVIFLCAGLWLLKAQPRRWALWFAMLVVVATLNRETAILLPLSVIAAKIDRRKWLYFAFFSTLWIVGYFSIRAVAGSAVDAVPVDLAWKGNMAMLNHGVFNQALFVPLWALYLRNWSKSPIFLKRLVFVALCYAALLIPFSLWNEVRLLLPLLVLTLPVVLNESQARGSVRAPARLDHSAHRRDDCGTGASDTRNRAGADRLVDHPPGAGAGAVADQA